MISIYETTVHYLLVHDVVVTVSVGAYPELLSPCILQYIVTVYVCPGDNPVIVAVTLDDSSLVGWVTVVEWEVPSITTSYL